MKQITAHKRRQFKAVLFFFIIIFDNVVFVDSERIKNKI